MAESTKLHIAMFPWLAFERLPKIPPNIATLITLVKLPLPHVENLPENAEATMDVPYHIVPYLKIAHGGLQEPLSRFLETRLGISRAFFSVFNALSLCFFGPPKRARPQHTNRTQAFHCPVKELLKNTEVNASGVSDLFRLMTVCLGTEVVAVKTCLEVKVEWLNLFGECLHIPAVPVGLLPPSPQEGNDIDNKDSTWDAIAEWLDKQEKGSVVYVALGSEIRPSHEDFNELALGLEQSRLPFFWALRKFEERTKGRGIVWTGWAPQFKILGHESVGGFVTHCGWSSVIEAFQFGHVLIMLPFIWDQGLVSRFLEERQAGVQILRKKEDGSFTRDSVTHTLRLAMKDEEGQIHRDRNDDHIW
ncbi:hypothetical protein I3760_08G140800 [Carya illinoinensis]|uniref:UDP-rhamnose:rhamnosyltransferase 1 n=1 Tax=Carya illinoinensis TaxID=32201 RepID=A0A8T1PVS2_CARIL|nr:hypothetical protein I3760_08G140800 [Carya illinoinensis]KAG6645723.1 hypothetical protein CIPAW_08G141900 [Carya illinoinensis]